MQKNQLVRTKSPRTKAQLNTMVGLFGEIYDIMEDLAGIIFLWTVFMAVLWGYGMILYLILKVFAAAGGIGI